MKTSAPKTLGLLGGMSWESTATYYRLINEGVRTRLGGHHSAKLLLYSVDFAEIEALQRAQRWDEAGRVLAEAATALQAGGAQCVVLCTNTMHEVAPQIERNTSIPLLHIVDPTGAAIRAAGLRSVGLLATRFTMEREFYVDRLRNTFGLRVVVPDEGDRELVHRVIYDELVHGQVRDVSRNRYLQVIDRLQEQGAEGVILGCTEISMLIDPASLRMPCFDTTELHARAAVEFSLS